MSFTEENFLIITFNEGAEDYTNTNIASLLAKIIEKQPIIIFVCTQESAFGTKTHFQHVFENNLLKQIPHYKRLYKTDGAKFGITLGFKSDKNCRTRIFYNTEIVQNNLLYSGYFSKSIPSKYSNKSVQINNSTFENESYKNNTKLNSTSTQKFKILKFGKYKSRQSGLTSVYEKTAFKSSILTRVELVDRSNNEYKFIVVNSHLFFKGNGNTGLAKRTEEFLKLMYEYKLYELYEKGYNIFFCGDLNFRLSNSTFRNKPNIKAHSKSILNQQVKGIIGNKQNLNNYNIKNELYELLKKKLNNSKNINESTKLYKLVNLFEQFKTSLQIIGFPLTCRLVEGRSRNNQQNKYSCNNKTQNSKALFGCVKNGVARIPSNCDKILFATQQNIKIEKSDLFMPTKPNESDHQLLALFPRMYPIIYNPDNNGSF